jgi:hypothetical protein
MVRQTPRQQLFYKIIDANFRKSLAKWFEIHPVASTEQSPVVNTTGLCYSICSAFIIGLLAILSCFSCSLFK